MYGWYAGGEDGGKLSQGVHLGVADLGKRRGGGWM